MSSRLLTRRLARWAIPPAALAAIGSFAAHEVDPAAAAEGAYLARLAAAALVAVAALAPAPASELGLGAALAVAAVWALPASPGRGAALVTLLTIALAIAGARRLRLSAAAGECNRADGGGGGDRDRLVTAVALCFGWQVVLRGELLFAPGRALRPWVALLVLPLVAGAALALLWRRRGMLPAMVAASAAAVPAPGWTVATTLALVALAGGELLLGVGWVSWRDALRERHPAQDWPAAVRWTVGAAALLLPVAWDPRAGWAAALAGLALWRPGWMAAAALLMAAGTRGATLAGLHLPGTFVAWTAHASWREGVAGVALLVMLVPAALPAARRPRSRALLVTAALVAFATPWLPDRSALAAPLALAALALPAAGAAAGLAAAWSAAALFGTALLASYPWLRQDPLGDTLSLLGTGPGPWLAAALGGAALLICGAVEQALRHAAALPATAPAGDLGDERSAGASGRDGPGASTDRDRPPGAPEDEMALRAVDTPRRRSTRRAAAHPARAGRIAAATAGCALFAALIGPQLFSPGIALLAGGSAVLLDRTGPSWQADVGLLRFRGLTLQTSLINGTALAGGTAVAHVRLLGPGAAAFELPLRAGDDTGEWAARRPDVAAAAGLRAPPPWQAWVAGSFFGQRYRARLPLPRTGGFERLEIDLAPGLPAGTGVALYQVELEP